MTAIANEAPTSSTSSTLKILARMDRMEQTLERERSEVIASIEARRRALLAVLPDLSRRQLSLAVGLHDSTYGRLSLRKYWSKDLVRRIDAKLSELEAAYAAAPRPTWRANG